MSNVVIGNAPVDSSEFARYKQRLLTHDWRAAGMLERLYINTRSSSSAHTADIDELRTLTIFALCAVGRGKDAEALIREDKAILGPELDPESGARTRRLMSFRFNWLRWAAARYAISKYQS